MPAQLAPSILSFDQGTVRSAVVELADAGADWIHFDVMDGQFVPPITFGDALVSGLRSVGNVAFEAHLMTQTPDRHFEAFKAAGCRRIIFHAEATAHSHRLAGQLHDMGLEAGVALNPGTPVEAAFPLLGLVDLVLVMTVNPGWGGQQLIWSCLDKVRRLRDLRPDLHIEVDGGMDPDTLPEALAAGADTFVVGSYLAKAESIAQGMSRLRERCG
ncbi:MAG: ribulose-phosphate 3-epimerase [Fimbriimonadaceae bacterium]|nr:ribulose-phosphate 3-epimerase [Fimbriimonadaceae bacterium]